MSATPRTDAAVINSGFQAVPFGFEEFARTLERELATERARMADLVADLNDACITLESAENDCDDYAMQNTAFKLMAVRNVLLQYIPDAAMKEASK